MIEINAWHYLSKELRAAGLVFAYMLPQPEVGSLNGEFVDG